MINEKKPYPQLITAEEITAIMERSGDFEDIRRSLEVAKAYRPAKAENIFLKMLWNDADFMRMLSNVYQAGRIQGIREERQKRKK